MALFDALRAAAATRRAYADLGGPLPFGITFDEVLSATRARAGGREVVLLGSNNYLGLANHPQVIEATTEAVRRFGSASRVSTTSEL